MTTQNIEKLIRKYMDGCTSCDEESALADALREATDHPEWDVFRIMLSVPRLQVDAESFLPKEEASLRLPAAGKQNSRKFQYGMKRVCIAAAVLVIVGIVSWTCFIPSKSLQEKRSWTSMSQTAQKSCVTCTTQPSVLRENVSSPSQKKQKQRSVAPKMRKKSVTIEREGGIQTSEETRDTITNLQVAPASATNIVVTSNVDSRIEAEYEKIYRAAYAYRNMVKQSTAKIY
jgi:cytoskeletal protein RodZ